MEKKQRKMIIYFKICQKCSRKKTIKDYDNGRKKKPLKKYEKLKKTKNIQSCVN